MGFIVDRCAIDMAHARLEALRHVYRAMFISCDDPTGETVFGIIVHRDCLCICVKAADDCNGTKGFIPPNIHAWIYMSQNCRFNKAAIHSATQSKFRAFGQGILQLRFNTVGLTIIDQGTDNVRFIGNIASFQFRSAGRKPLHKTVIDAVLDQYFFHTHTHLTLMHKGAKTCSGCRSVHIRIIQDNEAVFTSERHIWRQCACQRRLSL